MAEEVCKLVGQFVVPGLGEFIVGALFKVYNKCKEMKENEELCCAVHKRLAFVNEELQKIRDEQVVRQKGVLSKYGETIANFLHFLEKQSKKRLLRRLASNRKVIDAIKEFNEDIDELYRLLNIVHVLEMQKWRQTWEEDRKRQENVLLQTASNTQAIMADIQQSGSDTEVVLAMLGFELKHKAKHNTPKLYKAMRKAFNKVTTASMVRTPEIPEWFISSDDVDFDAKEAFDCGSYGSVYRGTYGKGSKVVIKCLLVEDERSKADFLREVKVWKTLSNPHVIQMYGACHVGTPVFFVCEDAMHGNFCQYFEKDENDEMDHKDRVWRLFYEAACGLDYLHKQKVVHGDLKCNNILVGGDHHAKICDFGFSYIRSQSVGLSAKAQTNTIRWKAPECLDVMDDTAPDANRNPRFASDVFSLGMCIIEAFSGEPPYGIDDDDTVMEYIMEGLEYPRPEGFEDDEWELVQRMCHPEWKERISLSATIDQLKQFKEREAENNAVDKTDRECPQCQGNVPVENAFCGECGLRLGEAATPA